MRVALIAVVLAFGISETAQAQVRLDRVVSIPSLGSFDILPDIPDFKLRTSTLDVFAATPSIIIPPRFSWVVDDGRAFWFSAGASAVVTLGTHVLVGLPTLVVTFSAAGSLAGTSPAAVVPVLLGAGATYMLVQTALASLASYLVFNGMSKVYDASYIVSLAAHIAGSFLGAGVSALVFGTGIMLIGGLTGLAEFTGSAGISAVSVFSVLGALPAVVIGGIALVGVPAIVGSWGMAVAATPKPGFAVDPSWKDPSPTLSRSSPRDSESVPVVALNFD
jgi:hypothetical protein